MFKNVAHFEHVIEGKVGHFLIENNTPIALAKEMLFEFLKRLGQIEDNVKAQQAAEAEAKANEPVPDISPANLE